VLSIVAFDAPCCPPHLIAVRDLPQRGSSHRDAMGWARVSRCLRSRGLRHL